MEFFILADDKKKMKNIGMITSVHLHKFHLSVVTSKDALKNHGKKS